MFGIYWPADLGNWPFLTKELKFLLLDEREEQERKEVFYYEGGIEEFITHSEYQ